MRLDAIDRELAAVGNRLAAAYGVRLVDCALAVIHHNGKLRRLAVAEREAEYWRTADE